MANSHCRGNRTETIQSRQSTDPSFAPLPLRNVSEMISLEQTVQGVFLLWHSFFFLPLLCFTNSLVGKRICDVVFSADAKMSSLQLLGI